MDSKDKLFDLGRIALQKQSVYLKLKIEKELAGEVFDEENELLEASIEWQRASNEYRSFFTSMQSNEESA